MGGVNVGIIGKGVIGRELYGRVLSMGWRVEWVRDSKNVYRNLDNIGIKDVPCGYVHYRDKLDLVFLAIPTFDDGNMAFYYIRNSVSGGVPVVTCEKGALSNYYSELENDINNGMLGYGASVGGVALGYYLFWESMSMRKQKRFML